MNFNLEKAKKIAFKAAEKLNLEIVSVKLVYEHGNKILRIIADKEFGLTLDDSERLNMLIGEALDEDDVFDEEYFLEVSSVGAERQLKTLREIKNAIGRYVSIKTVKDLQVGDLIEVNDDKVILRVNHKGRIRNLEINNADITEIRLAIKF